MAKFGTGANQIQLVHSNGSDRIFVYDTAEVLSVWNPYTNDILGRTIIQKVRCLEYAPDAGSILYALSHNGSQLQILNAETLELATLFVSLEQELIEYTYDHDVLDLANLEMDSLISMHALPNK